MNATDRATAVANLINTRLVGDFRATVTPKGSVQVEKDSGGKRGWVVAGYVNVTDTASPDKSLEFAMGKFAAEREVLEAIKTI